MWEDQQVQGLQVHSGLFSNEPVPLDSGLSRKTLVERLSEKAMQEIDPHHPLLHPEPKDSDASSDEEGSEGDDGENSGVQFDV